MNDFTKDELEIICNGIGWLVYARAYHEMVPVQKLKNKVQSMIDNYYEHECEHKWMKCFYGEKSIPINLCVLCNLRERR
jgi:hypothetical protein